MADRTTRTVLVAGGTGALGLEVVRRLLRDPGARVVGLSRRERYPVCVACQPRFDRILADATRPDDLAAELRGRSFDVLVNCVGVHRESAPDDTFEALHVQAVTHLLSAARDAGARRFVQVSALGRGLRSASRWQRTKGEGERLVRESGLPFVVLRPALALGPGTEAWEVLGRVSRWKVVPLPRGGATRLQPVPAEDLAEVIARVALREDLAGRTLDVAGSEPVPAAVLVEEFARRLLGRAPRIVTVPTPLARAAAAIPGTRAALRVSRDHLAMLEEEELAEDGACFDLLGVPRRSWRAALPRLADEGAAPPAATGDGEPSPGTSADPAGLSAPGATA